MISPGAWLGLLGGGQLGRMFCMAAQSMGYKVAVLDPGQESPAGTVADLHIRRDYLDTQGLEELARLAGGVTTEFENVPARALEFLASRCQVNPQAESVAIAQDRIREKAFVAGCDVGVAPYAEVRDAGAIASLPADLFPGILKVARLGYDGKGQARVATPAEAAAAFAEFGGVPCVLEKRLDLMCELSVVVARGRDGATAVYPVSENEHKGGILDTTIVPARVSEALTARARAAALTIARRLDYAGVLCVEFFVLRDNTLLVNELAPRPHNSGHYSIDACVTSQFEQQVRVLAGLPLGDTRQHTAAVMINVLGESWHGADLSLPPDWSRVLAHDAAKLHLYGKSQARPGRKMGHITVLGASVEEAIVAAAQVRGALGAG
ncbi:MAG: 5-(carboxyamino)imidazole ribonucleotide synthase [Burkholderiales bacterium]|nr:5-(carboxyamino)imidazole ribonucleotide synthase [Burkholderiales bacterium]